MTTRSRPKKEITSLKGEFDDKNSEIRFEQLKTSNPNTISFVLTEMKSTPTKKVGGEDRTLVKRKLRYFDIKCEKVSVHAVKRQHNVSLAPETDVVMWVHDHSMKEKDYADMSVDSFKLLLDQAPKNVRDGVADFLRSKEQEL